MPKCQLMTHSIIDLSATLNTNDTQHIAIRHNARNIMDSFATLNIMSLSIMIVSISIEWHYAVCYVERLRTNFITSSGSPSPTYFV